MRKKLTELDWRAIESRVNLGAESYRTIAKDYGITEGAIRKRFPNRNRDIKEVATNLANAEMALERLPLRSQTAARTLADDLKEITSHLCGAAKYGAMTAHRLNGIAQSQVELIDDSSPFGDMTTLQSIAVLNKMSNVAGDLGVRILAANKDLSKPSENTSDLLAMVIDRLPN